MSRCFHPPVNRSQLAGMSISVFSYHRVRLRLPYDIPARIMSDADDFCDDDDVLLLHGSGMALELLRISPARQGCLPPVVVLAPQPDWSDVSLALGIQARGYLLENRHGVMLPHALLCAVHGGCVLDPVIAARQIQAAAEVRARARRRYELTRAEQRLMELISAGLSVWEVAEELSVTRPTVRNQLSRVYRKLGVHTRSEAILRWLSHGETIMFAGGGPNPVGPSAEWPGTGS